MSHAREIADAGDRWFLSVASGLGRLGGWARHEANIAADSAVAAFATTVGVAKKLAGAVTPKPKSQTVPVVHTTAPPEISAPATPSSESGIDLVVAVPAGASVDPQERHGVLPDGALSRHSAGVVPLLQALGRMVSGYTHQGYASLQQDDRFWTLIHLLQRLGRPNIAGAPHAAEPAAPDPPPSLHSNYDSRSEP